MFNRIFAAGDVTERQEIKLAGSAMVMGAVAGANAYSILVAEEQGINEPILESCDSFYLQPRMALAVGKNIVCYGGGESPICDGEELAETCFGQDLVWQSKFC